MSDELTFLRWYYRNAIRFIRRKIASTGVGGETFEYVTGYSELLTAYTEETGNGVPGDYKLVA